VAVLKSQFEILRGWPNGSAVAEDFTIGGTSTNNHEAGKWVSLDPSAPTVMTTADSYPSSGVGTKCFLIVEGQEDTSSKMSNTVTCMLGGGYIVKLHNTEDDKMFDTQHGGAADWAYVPGMPVKVVSGIIAPALLNPANGAALTDLDDAAWAAADVAQLDARDAIVGHVVRYVSGDEPILEVYIR
jgi:hypothetical protein